MAEFSWLIGTILCALGVALCTKANFGLSMLTAPAYIIHLAVSKILPWYTQGTSEYIFQAGLLLLICLLVKRFRIKYLLSFGTAVIFGLVIDGWLWVFGGSAPFSTLPMRLAAFAFGELITALSIAFVFRSYLPPQMAECLVMELSAHFKVPQGKIKQINDIVFLILSFLLSLILTGGFTGVGWGTIVITLVNAPLIQWWGKLLDRYMEFDPMFPRLKAWFD